jgi:hypothetical protein
LIVYLGLFFVAFCFLAALPDLFEAARSLPPGPQELTPEEVTQAERIARESLRGKIPFALLAAVVATGIAAHQGWLPGLRRRP